MKVRRLLKLIAEHDGDFFAAQSSSNHQHVTNFSHHISFNCRMLSTASTKRKDPFAIWTDVNKRVLIEALSLHSGGRYSNLANAKGKWKLVVADFQSATGQMQVPTLLRLLFLESLIRLQTNHRFVVFEECAYDPDHIAEEKLSNLPSICLSEWLWC
jgi:hypothetical protein